MRFFAHFMRFLAKFEFSAVATLVEVELETRGERYLILRKVHGRSNKRPSRRTIHADLSPQSRSFFSKGLPSEEAPREAADGHQEDPLSDPPEPVPPPRLLPLLISTHALLRPPLAAVPSSPLPPPPPVGQVQVLRLRDLLRRAEHRADAHRAQMSVSHVGRGRDWPG